MHRRHLRWRPVPHESLLAVPPHRGHWERNVLRDRGHGRPSRSRIRILRTGRRNHGERNWAP